MRTPLPRYWRRLGAVAAAVIVAVATLSCNSSEPEEEKASDGEGEGSGTSPQDPYPAGSEVEVASWKVTLSNLRFDVTEEVLESDPYGYGIGPSSGN